MGAAMGAGVGLTMGFLFGTFSILRYVPRLFVQSTADFIWVL